MTVVQGNTDDPGFEVDQSAAAADTQNRAGEVADRSAHLKAADNALLRCDEVVAGYVPGVNILNGCDLYVGDGELVGIIGPNGAGKSTLLKAMIFHYLFKGKSILSKICRYLRRIKFDE